MYVTIQQRFNVFTVMEIQVILWVVTLKMEALRSSEMLVSYQITTQHHNPQDHDWTYPSEYLRL